MTQRVADDPQTWDLILQLIMFRAQAAASVEGRQHISLVDSLLADKERACFIIDHFASAVTSTAVQDELPPMESEDNLPGILQGGQSEEDQTSIMAAAMKVAEVVAAKLDAAGVKRKHGEVDGEVPSHETKSEREEKMDEEKSLPPPPKRQRLNEDVQPALSTTVPATKWTEPKKPTIEEFFATHADVVRLLTVLPLIFPETLNEEEPAEVASKEVTKEETKKVTMQVDPKPTKARSKTVNLRRGEHVIFRITSVKSLARTIDRAFTSRKWRLDFALARRAQRLPEYLEEYMFGGNSYRSQLYAALLRSIFADTPGAFEYIPVKSNKGPHFVFNYNRCILSPQLRRIVDDWFPGMELMEPLTLKELVFPEYCPKSPSK